MDSREKQPCIYMIHGFIGYGKTTYAKKFAAEIGAIRFTHDEWIEELYGKKSSAEDFHIYYDKVMNKIGEMTEELIKRGHSVIIDNGFWTRRERDIYRDKAQKLGAKAVILSMQCNLDIAKNRINNRNKELGKGEFYVDKPTLEFFMQKFEPLEPDEEFFAVTQ